MLLHLLFLIKFLFNMKYGIKLLILQILLLLLIGGLGMLWMVGIGRIWEIGIFRGFQKMGVKCLYLFRIRQYINWKWGTISFQNNFITKVQTYYIIDFIYISNPQISQQLNLNIGDFLHIKHLNSPFSLLQQIKNTTITTMFPS